MPGAAVENPTFEPAMRLISLLSKAENAQITTSFAHGYLEGLVVRIIVPEGFGMLQINGMLGTILTVPTTETFTVDIDTRLFDTFVYPDPVPWYINEYPAVVAVGEIAEKLNQPIRNVL